MGEIASAGKTSAISTRDCILDRYDPHTLSDHDPTYGSYMPIQFDWVTSLSGCFVVFGAVVFAIAFMDRRYHEIPSKYLIVATRICKIVCNKYDFKEYTLLYNYEIGSMKYSGKSNSSYINDEVKEWVHLNIYVNPDNHTVSYTENDIMQLKKMKNVLMFLGALFMIAGTILLFCALYADPFAPRPIIGVMVCV